MTVISRATARPLSGDADGRVLLRHGSDAERAYWFTIGGGVEPGEGLAEAAVRELRGESGGMEISFDGHRQDEAGWIDDARWWDPADLGSVPLGRPALPEIGRAAVGSVRTDA